MNKEVSKYRVNKKSIVELMKLHDEVITYDEAEALYIYLQQLAEVCYHHLKKKSL